MLVSLFACSSALVSLGLEMFLSSIFLSLQ